MKSHNKESIPNSAKSKNKIPSCVIHPSRKQGTCKSCSNYKCCDPKKECSTPEVHLKNKYRHDKKSKEMKRSRSIATGQRISQHKGERETYNEKDQSIILKDEEGISISLQNDETGITN